jgi:SAM-dependent methyltransferase
MRVNIGCGATPTSGWINFDNSLAIRLARRPLFLSALKLAGLLDAASLDLAATARAEDIRFADAVRQIPCADGSVDVVYSAHMVEHLDPTEARRFLREVRRVLRPGGIVRLAAPDLALLADRYQITQDADEFVLGTYMAQERPAGLRSRAKFAVVGPRHHLWMYDGESLAGLLRSAGFADVAVLPAGETMIADPGSLDLKERAHETVYAEAVNPGGAAW